MAKTHKCMNIIQQSKINSICYVELLNQARTYMHCKLHVCINMHYLIVNPCSKPLTLSLGRFHWCRILPNLLLRPHTGSATPLWAAATGGRTPQHSAELTRPQGGTKTGTGSQSCRQRGKDCNRRGRSLPLPWQPVYHLRRYLPASTHCKKGGQHPNFTDRLDFEVTKIAF